MSTNLIDQIMTGMPESWDGDEAAENGEWPVFGRCQITTAQLVPAEEVDA